MARPSNKGPLDRYRWSVEIDGFGKLGFSSCETPSVALKITKYAEGANHLYPKNIVDSVEYRPVTLQRGVTSDLDFDKWVKSYFDFLRGFRMMEKGENWPTQQPTEYRKTVIIKHLDRAGRAVKVYTLYNAFPIEYKPASDFSADTDDTLSMEKLVLTYESFSVESITPNKNPVDPSDVFKRLIRRS